MVSPGDLLSISNAMELKNTVFVKKNFYRKQTLIFSSYESRLANIVIDGVFSMDSLTRPGMN